MCTVTALESFLRSLLWNSGRWHGLKRWLSFTLTETHCRYNYLCRNKSSDQSSSEGSEIHLHVVNTLRVKVKVSDIHRQCSEKLSVCRINVNVEIFTWGKWKTKYSLGFMGQCSNMSVSILNITQRSSLVLWVPGVETLLDFLSWNKLCSFAQQKNDFFIQNLS